MSWSCRKISLSEEGRGVGEGGGRGAKGARGGTKGK